MEEPKLYTIHGGTAIYKKVAQTKVAQIGEYVWMVGVDERQPPMTVHSSSIHEVPVYNYLTCKIEGSNVTVYKKALKNSSVHVGMSLVTKHGSVLTIKEISGQVPPYDEEELMDPVKIPMLEGRRIKFVKDSL